MANAPAQNPWWLEEKDGLAQALATTGKQLEERQSPMFQRQLQAIRLYDNRAYDGLRPDRLSENYSEDGASGVGSGYADADYLSPLTGTKDPLVLNALRSAIDTANARITQERPRVMVITEGGSWKDRNKARHMQKAVDGLLDTYGAYTIGERVQRDSMVCRFGVMRMGIGPDQEGKPDIFIDWTAPWKWLVDEAAAQTAPPRQLYHHDWFPLEYVKETYAKTDDEERQVNLFKALDNAATYRGLEVDSVSALMVEVWEGWSIDGPGKKGRHSVVAGNEYLVDEEWEPEYSDDPEQLPFPVEILRWANPMAGFSGISACDEVRSIQEDIDRVGQANQRADHAGSFVHVVKEKSVKEEDLPEEQITNRERVVWPRGVNIIKPDPVGDAQRSWPMRMVELVYNIMGVSSYEANPGEPDTSLSGVALRNIERNATVRFSRKEAAYGRLYLRIAKRLIRLVRKVAEKNPGAAQILVREAGQFNKIQWADVDLPDESFKIQMFPTSQLPRDPAGKLQYVQEMISTGFIDPAYAATLFEIPDVEAYQNIRLAGIRYIGFVMDKMLYDGESTPVSGMEDLGTAIDWCAATWMYGSMHGAPQAHLDMLAEWRLNAQTMMDQQMVDQAQKAQAMQAMLAPPAVSPPGAPPMGVPPDTDIPPTPPAGMGPAERSLGGLPPEGV